MGTVLVLCECGCGQPAPIATKTYTKFGHVQGRPMRFVRGHAMRGKKASEETRQKMRAAHKRGPDHPEWKGENIAYSTLHLWLRREATKTGKCSACGVEGKRTEWANLSGDYRRDLSDFSEMCVSCHKRFDYAKKREAA
jgi:hypothetical protein